jgi:hypothetical protein
MHVRSIPSHGSQARDRERLLANLAIRRDIVQIADVKLVDLKKPALQNDVDGAISR